MLAQPKLFLAILFEFFDLDCGHVPSPLTWGRCRLPPASNPIQSAQESTKIALATVRYGQFGIESMVTYNFYNYRLTKDLNLSGHLFWPL